MKTISYLQSILQNKCPKCRSGYLFEKKNPYNLKYVTKMVEKCPICKQPTELEVGFYYGTGYVSYALTVAFTIFIFIAWKVLIGFSIKTGDYRIYYCLFFNIISIILLQPIFMRYSRTIWLSWFVKYQPNT